MTVKLFSLATLFVSSSMYVVVRRAHRVGTPLVAPMPAPPANGEIMAGLRALRAEMAELRVTVANGLQPVTAPLDDEDAMKRDVRVEIAQMVRSIGRAKAEIAAIKNPTAETDQMESASHQLEAITATTENSTNEIMTAVDDIEQVLKDRQSTRLQPSH